MGQAKQRGSKEERAAQALAKVEAIKPKVIVCNNCKTEIIDVHTMDARNIVGIEGAFAGMCECGHTTWAVSGHPDAVAGLMESLHETTGGESIIGSMPIKRN
jgi:uncharacterized protein with PIN domain